MTDVSRSGCFIETALRVAPLSSVRVIFASPDAQERRTFGDGIGLGLTEELTVADLALMNLPSHYPGN